MTQPARSVISGAPRFFPRACVCSTRSIGASEADSDSEPRTFVYAEIAVAEIHHCRLDRLGHPCAFVTCARSVISAILCLSWGARATRSTAGGSSRTRTPAFFIPTYTTSGSFPARCRRFSGCPCCLACERTARRRASPRSSCTSRSGRCCLSGSAPGSWRTRRAIPATPWRTPSAHYWPACGGIANTDVGLLQAMSFDALAPHYRWMEFMLAGEKLQRCRTAFLNEIRGAWNILLLGEGPGRCLLECVRRFANARITCVDASGPMLTQARRRLEGQRPGTDRVT